MGVGPNTRAQPRVSQVLPGKTPDLTSMAWGKGDNLETETVGVTFLPRLS